MHHGSRRIAAALLLVASPVFAATFVDDFTAPLSANWETPRTEETGSSVTAPVADFHAVDGQVVQLLFPGRTPVTDSGPGFATEVQTSFAPGYGTYEARLRTAKASRSTGLVSAFFTYFNDGSDHNGNGVIDNHEIDFEFLAAEPSSIYMTVWTEYQDVGGVETFRKTTRKVDLRSGRVWQTPPGGEGSYDIVETDPLPWTAKSYRSWRTYCDYRFVWSAGAVEYAVDLGDGMGFRALWSLSGIAADTIPSIPAPLFFNLWHNATHWNTGAATRVPRKDATMRIDSVSITN